MKTNEPNEKFRQQLADWDKLIRSGQASQVSQMCRKLNHRQIPRELLLDYAQIARRIDAPNLIVFWFASIIRSDKVLEKKATDSEKAIYALGLLRLGAFREASQILSEVRPEADPQVRFYRASLYMNQWNYRKAIPELKKYVRDPRVPIYSRMVGRLNLCASLVSARKSRIALVEISILMKKLEKNKLFLLKGNLLEIRSQLYFEMGNFDEAMANLEEASHFLKNANSRSRIYVDKWKAMVKLSVSTSNESALTEIEAIKLRAEAVADWESVRDCDLQLALRTKDKSLLLRVYWGSIFTEYKSRALKLFQWTDEVPQEFIWTSGIFNDKAKPINLVQEAPTPILRKLFFVLTREFYRPLRITELFDLIYDDEYYNPKSGSEKLRRLLFRARKWLAEKNYSIDIKAYRNGYKLHFLKNVSLILRKEFEPIKLIEFPTNLVARERFTSQEWAIESGISTRTARRQLLNLTKDGFVESSIRGPKTFYKKAR